MLSMKRTHITVAALAAITFFLAAGCGYYISNNAIAGSGNVVTQQFEYSDFSKVDAGSTFHVTIKQGPKYEVAIAADDNIMDSLDVSRREDTLRITLKPNTSIRNATLNADITMPQLSGVKLAGASKGTLASFDSEAPLRIRLSGASSLHGQVKAKESDFELGGASRLNLTGTTGKLGLKSEGASHANLDDYPAQDAIVSASGASHVTISTVGVLDVYADGASSVRHVGKPAKLNAHTSGASSVREK
jgi:hypothetical protein